MPVDDSPLTALPFAIRLFNSTERTKGRYSVRCRGYHRSHGFGTGPQATRNVHRHHRAEGFAPSGLRGGGQFDRRSVSWALRFDQREYPSQQQRRGRGQRSGHPVRRPPCDGEVVSRDGAVRAARRWQIWWRVEWIQSVWWAARSGNLSRQCPQRESQRAGRARRLRSRNVLRARGSGHGDANTTCRSR